MNMKSHCDKEKSGRCTTELLDKPLTSHERQFASAYYYIILSAINTANKLPSKVFGDFIRCN